MKLKKYMQQKAEEEFSSVLTESDMEYCRQIEAEYQARSLRYNRKFWAFFSCAAAVLVGAVIAICIVFSPRKPTFWYQGEKKSVDSTIIELNADAKNFMVDTPPNTSCIFSKTYDVESGDSLYYELSLKGYFEDSKFVFVINKNYDYSFTKPIDVKQESFAQYSLNYSSVKTASKEEGVFDCTYTAWIQLKTETIYITYTQSPELGDQAFFDYVQKVVKAK